MTTINSIDRQRISDTILDKYKKVSTSPKGLFRYPTGREGLEKQRYDLDLVGMLPPEVQKYFCGVGNPFSLGRPRPGQKVLDVGCGGGVDTLLAALMVGPEGDATGIELSGDMVERARQNQLLSGVGNASFQVGDAERLAFEADSFDLVISSGAFNLVVEKEKALAEVFRVLKKGGRLQVADQIRTGAQPLDQEAVVASWFT